MPILLQNIEMEAKEHVKKYLDEIGFDFYLIDRDWLMENLDEVFLVDVRMPDEFKKSHIPGASNIPLKKLSRYLDEFPADRKIVLYCNTGALSAQAVVLLRLSGYSAYGLLEGITGWEKAGYPVEGEKS